MPLIPCAQIEFSDANQLDFMVCADRVERLVVDNTQNAWLTNVVRIIRASFMFNKHKNLSVSYVELLLHKVEGLEAKCDRCLACEIIESMYSHTPNTKSIRELIDRRFDFMFAHSPISDRDINNPQSLGYMKNQIITSLRDITIQDIYKLNSEYNDYASNM